MILIQAKTIETLAKILTSGGVTLGAIWIMLRFLTPDEKKAWAVAITGYVWAAIRYVFSAGTISQRLAQVEKKVDILEQLSLDVAYIKGELHRMNGRGH